MRIKNDTIIKWRNLKETMNLTNEEFGILIRNVMIEDDAKGIRYEHIPERALKFYIKKEKEWIDEFDELCEKNPKLIQAFLTVFGQASHSHRAFDQKQKEYDEKDKQKKIQEIMKSENCSYEEALGIYNFMQPAEPKAEPKTKSNLHNFNVFGIPFSFEYNSDINFTNEELENEFADIKEYLATDEDLVKRIINDTFKSAIYDNFQKDLKEYYDENN